MYEMVFLAIGAINLIGITAVLLGSKKNEGSVNTNMDKNIQNDDILTLKKVS